jgi:hypothetical protein
MVPVDETDRQRTNGGDNDTVVVCGTEAMGRCDPLYADGSQETTYRTRALKVKFLV